MNRWLEEIYRSDRRALFALALSVTRRPAMAEDAVHEAVVRLAGKGCPPEGDARAYVFRSVRNAALDQLRAVRRGVAGKTLPPPSAVNGSGLPIFVDPGPCPAEQSEQHEQRRRLRSAVQTLPDAQREAVVMKVFGGLTFQQIAEASDAPLSTIASRYQRGLARLKTQLETQHEPTTTR